MSGFLKVLCRLGVHRYGRITSTEGFLTIECGRCGKVRFYEKPGKPVGSIPHYFKEVHGYQGCQSSPPTPPPGDE